MATKLTSSSILTAFDTTPIGSKVTDHGGFFTAALEAIEVHDFSQGHVPGQGFIICPEALPYVSAGDGLRTADPTDYSPRLHRGQVELFLNRERAGEPKFCALVVYMTEAYLSDPEVDGVEALRIRESEATHVLVAVIASSGPQAPLTPGRLVANLAGGKQRGPCLDRGRDPRQGRRGQRLLDGVHCRSRLVCSPKTPSVSAPLGVEEP